ncbi:MAG TPA: hypothetical protein V6C85_26800, partial [Allocoleopsis sp.]
PRVSVPTRLPKPTVRSVTLTTETLGSGSEGVGFGRKPPRVFNKSLNIARFPLRKNYRLLQASDWHDGESLTPSIQNCLVLPAIATSQLLSASQS